MDSALQRLLANGEQADFELKASLSDTRKIIETIAAMATLGGGTLLIGVKNDGWRSGGPFIGSAARPWQ